MLQFFDRIISKQGFVDLHNHTNDSYGEEMNQMNLSPEELLESVYEYTQINSCPATFALTDHNSIEGVQKIDLALKSNPKKYKDINFITGCEFTCSGGSLGEIKNNEGHIKNVISNFHMLAYGFNPYDETLSFLCKLHSTKRENSIMVETNKGKIKISAGAYVLSIKNILKDYGLTLSLNDFKDVNLNTHFLDEKKYIQYLMTYIQNKFDLPEMTKKDIFYQLSNRNLIGLGRLDCKEVMEIVENAGGYCVLAHPYLVKLGSYAKNNELKTKAFFKAKLKTLEVNFDKNASLQTLQITYLVHVLSHNVYSPITKKVLNGLAGIEVLHVSSNINPKMFEEFVKIANNNNLYITCGSDSHGTLKSSTNYLSKFAFTETNSMHSKNNIVCEECLFANKILDGTIKTAPKCDKSFDEQIKILKTEQNFEEFINLQDYCKLIVNTRVNKPHPSEKKLHEKRIKNIELTKKFSEATNNLTIMIELFNNALQNNELTDKQALKQYKLICSLLEPVKTALDIYYSNKKVLNGKKYIDRFFNQYKQYLQIKKGFKRKYKHLFKSQNVNNKKSNNKNKNVEKSDNDERTF